MTGLLLYTEEDVEHYAKIICDGFDALPDDAHHLPPSVPLFVGTTYMPPPQPACLDCVHVARNLFAALSSANRLVPPGSEVREEPKKPCDCSCHRCCVPLDAWCEDCEEDHAKEKP